MTAAIHRPLISEALIVTPGCHTRLRLWTWVFHHWAANYPQCVGMLHRCRWGQKWLL